MIVQLNTDKNIKGTENLEKYVSDQLEDALKHIVNHVTRIEVYLSDQNADKGGPDDIKCKIEARVEGKKPVMVEGKSDSKEEALDDAVKKIKASLTSVIDKMKNK